ncbi:hypothetical protein ACF0H5_003780 [Mactra antiquata]
MADQEQKAIQFVDEAEKKLKSSKGFFGSMFGGSSKVEEAAELFVRAANAFKMAKKWPGAGQCFCRAAELQLQLGSKHEAATHYVDAGSAYKKSDPQESVNCLGKAIEIYTDMGRFTIAAKHHVSIAEIYESELADMDKAMSSYQQAADYYKGEESNSSANKCSLKVAQYAAQLERYEQAIEIYEEVAISCMDNSLLKYSAKDHFFRAATCHLCVDTLNGEQALQKYEGLFPQFADSRECKLLKNLVSACEEEDADTFTDAIKEYDTISRLDQWTTTMLLRVKKRINQDDLK